MPFSRLHALSESRQQGDLKFDMKTKNLTEGPILKSLLIFFGPMLAGNLLQQIYNFADALIVGRFVGANALAAVGSTYTLMTFLTSVIIGLCMGSGAIFSANFGAGKKQEMGNDIALSFLFIFSVTILLYLIIFPLTDPILHLLQVPAEIYDMMRSYVRLVFYGIGFIFLYNFFANLMRALGNAGIPLVFLGIASVVNIILDLLLVIYFKCGVEGAAIATVISQGLAGLGIAVYAYVKIPLLRHLRYDFHFDRQRMALIMRNDLATGMQQSVMNFGILMIQGLVNSFGTVIMAAFAAAVKIDTIAYMPAQEFGNAYSLFISQNYGAGKAGRIREGTKKAMLTTTVFCLLISGLVFVFARQLMCLFVERAETRIIAAGVSYLHIEGACYVGIGILFLWYGYYRGIQLPVMSLILTIISLGSRVLLAYTLAPHTALGVFAIWMAIPIGWLLADLTGYIIYKKRT